MRRYILALILCLSLFFADASFARSNYVNQKTQTKAAKRRIRKKTAKRVGVGAAGGAAVGALAGGGKGAAIGALAGGGAGYVYDRHKKHKRRRGAR